MKVLCGVDIVEVDRIKENLDKEGFKERVYTDIEIKYCDSKKVKAVESYAARFAVKEAFSKAIGTGIAKGIMLKDIEVYRAEGKPEIKLFNQALEMLENKAPYSIDVSISHTNKLAIATVVILINE